MENIVILTIEEYQRLLAIENQYAIMLEEEEKMLEEMYQEDLSFKDKLAIRIYNQN